MQISVLMLFTENSRISTYSHTEEFDSSSHWSTCAHYNTWRTLWHHALCETESFCKQMVLFKRHHHHHHYHHFPPWIRSFDLFRHRRITIVSWGVHDLVFLEVCSWGRVSGVWCCPFFHGGWSSFVCIWVSRLVFHRSLVLFLWLRFLFYPALCIP